MISAAADLDFSTALKGLRDMGQGFLFRLPYFGMALVVFFLFYMASKGSRSLAKKLAERRTRHRNLAYLLGRLAQATLIVIGVLVALVVAIPTFKPGQVVQLLGITSIAIGFAFRDILQNFLAGIILLFTEPFRLGDQIKFGEFEGVVEEIQTRATMIRTYDARKIVIPNANLFTNPITVNTAFEQRRLEYEFGIGYGDSIEQTRGCILRALNAIEDILKDPPPEVLVVGFAANSVLIRVRWWITPPRRFEALASQTKVLETIKSVLAENGIDLPFEVRTVLFHDQTEDSDGNRANQREGWPSGNQNPKANTIAGALAQLADSLKTMPPKPRS